MSIRSRQQVLTNPRTALVLALALMGSAAQAALITQSTALNQNVTQNGFTNSAAQSFFSFATVFNQFNPALGTLNSAKLEWTTTGHITAIGNLEASATLSYQGQSAVKNADTDGNPPNDVDFLFNGNSILALAGLLGVGTVDLGNFTGTVSNAGGFFPWGANLSALGTISLVYDYTVADTGGGPGRGVPEPAPLALLALALAGLALTRRRA